MLTQINIEVGSFNTQPPEGGWAKQGILNVLGHRFQHTAARRRLDGDTSLLSRLIAVSTHSRPKAAGTSMLICVNI